MSEDANVASDFEEARERFDGDSVAGFLGGNVVGSRAVEAKFAGGPVLVAAGLAGRRFGFALVWRLRRTVCWDRASARYGRGVGGVAGEVVGGCGKLGSRRLVGEAMGDLVGKVSEEARGVPLALVRPLALLRCGGSSVGGLDGGWRVEGVNFVGGVSLLFVPCGTFRIDRLLTLFWETLLTSFSLLR